MDFRQYDPAIGRFSGIDLLAESSYNLTPYHFSNNNPIIFSDPSGLKAKAEKMSTYGDQVVSVQQQSGGILSLMQQGYNGLDIRDQLVQDAWGMSLFGGGGGGGGGSTRSIIDKLWNITPENGSLNARFGQNSKGSYYIYTTAEYGPEPEFSGINKMNSLGEIVLGWQKVYIDFKKDDTVLQAGIGVDFFNYGGAFMNIGGSLVGISEMAASAARKYDNAGGAKHIARALTKLKGSYVGTQNTAKYLRTFQAGAKSLGTKLGVGGAILATYDYAYNFQEKNGYEHANYWIGEVVTIGAFVNPVGAGIALGYGIGQGISWLYNGKTLEENVGKSVGW